MRKKSIVLIGMPGVGKSTIGVVLAKNLGISFIDSDLVIQEREEKSFKRLLRSMALKVFLISKKL